MIRGDSAEKTFARILYHAALKKVPDPILLSLYASAGKNDLKLRVTPSPPI